MSKIVKAINIMIENPEKITNVIKRNNEFFFKFLDKQKWSINKKKESLNSIKNNYAIYYYSTEKTLEELSNLNAGSSSDWSGIDIVFYSTKTIKTREAYESFEQLYTKLNEKIYDIDKIFNEIFDIDKL